MGKGIMLSRLGGGIGTRGPGEQKLEVDRRRIRARIGRLGEELERLGRRREATRSRRKESTVPVAALVGYTNAGKTTLLNRLTGAGGTVQDQLFTTLDPLARRMRLPAATGAAQAGGFQGYTLIVTDTVGFLHHLPHHLIEAFKATLEEARDADVLLHVLDVSHPLASAHAEAVEEVLQQLALGHKPVITVLNKCDRLEDPSRLAALTHAFAPSAAISAKTGQGIEQLTALIEERLSLSLSEPVRLRVPLERADILAAIYQSGHVLARTEADGALTIRVRLPDRLQAALAQYLLS